MHCFTYRGGQGNGVGLIRCCVVGPSRGQRKEWQRLHAEACCSTTIGEGRVWYKRCEEVRRDMYKSFLGNKIRREAGEGEKICRDRPCSLHHSPPPLARPGRWRRRKIEVCEKDNWAEGNSIWERMKGSRQVYICYEMFMAGSTREAYTEREEKEERDPTVTPPPALPGNACHACLTSWSRHAHYYFSHTFIWCHAVAWKSPLYIYIYTSFIRKNAMKTLFIQERARKCLLIYIICLLFEYAIISVLLREMPLYIRLNRVIYIAKRENVIILLLHMVTLYAIMLLITEIKNMSPRQRTCHIVLKLYILLRHYCSPHIIIIRINIRAFHAKRSSPHYRHCYGYCAIRLSLMRSVHCNVHAHTIMVTLSLILPLFSLLFIIN